MDRPWEAPRRGWHLPQDLNEDLGSAHLLLSFGIIPLRSAVEMFIDFLSLPLHSSSLSRLTGLCLRFCCRWWPRWCYSCAWTRLGSSSVTCQTAPSARPSWRLGGVWRPGCAWRRKTKDRYRWERLRVLLSLISAPTYLDLPVFSQSVCNGVTRSKIVMEGPPHSSNCSLKK